jgi:hypothetical protein
MLYEVRSWSSRQVCLYTDDHRLHDLASHSRDLRIVSTYFHPARKGEASAWDIVGTRDRIADLTTRFSAAEAPTVQRA